MALESPSTATSASAAAVPAGPGQGPLSASSLRVLLVGSEAGPFAKTGGLGDVLGSLPRALAERGHECAVILPLYNACKKAGVPIEPTALSFQIPMAARSVPGRLWRSTLPNSRVVVYLVEQPDYFERDDPAEGKGIYQYRQSTGKMRDYTDNCQRFIFFSRAVLEALRLLGFWPDVLHCNDWQTGLIPVYLRELYGGLNAQYQGVRTLYTIHNLAYQGIFWHWDMALTGLDWRLFNWRQLEFYGKLNLMKAGIVFADRVSTVSPHYAEEIQTPEHGCGLEGVLRFHRDKLVGISNGIDYQEWNPATDVHLPVRYTPETVSEGKTACKAALQERVHLPQMPRVPLLGMVTRLAEQKGIDLLAGVAGSLLHEDVQLVVLGTGDAGYHEMLKRLMARYPQKVAAMLTFDESLAHLIEAGADMFLMPSRFEPSGLNQLYSLKYGTPPVVRNTGGLTDTVTDCTEETLANHTATGFMFTEYTPAAFLSAIRRALDCYRRPALWRQLQQTGMNQDWSWQHGAEAYEKLYREMCVKQ